MQFGELPVGYDHKYVYSHFGYNLKVTDMQAAIGCAQLEKLPEFTRIRRENWEYLKEELTELEEYFELPEPMENSCPSWFGFLLTLKPNMPFSRVDLVKHIESKNIQTRLLFSGNILKHPCFDEMRRTGEGYRVVGSLKNTDRIMNDSFWIGVYPGMTRPMLEAMVSTIKEFVKQY
jgi:CDP-6-deoxy-D-xylo-4-hexulose-3-dehydrase